MSEIERITDSGGDCIRRGIMEIKTHFAKSLGWTIERAEREMIIIPNCMNCKSSRLVRGVQEQYLFCNKHKISLPKLCRDWAPHKRTCLATAVARAAYLDLKKGDEA